VYKSIYLLTYLLANQIELQPRYLTETNDSYTRNYYHTQKTKPN